MAEASIALDTDETVDLLISGARVSYLDTGGVTSFQLPADGPGPKYLALNLDHPAVTVTRAVPADGEPKPGDLWRDRHGMLYAALVAGGEPWAAGHEGYLFLTPVLADGRVGKWRDIHADPQLGPITLEYRPAAAAAAAIDLEAVLG